MFGYHLRAENRHLELSATRRKKARVWCYATAFRVKTKVRDSSEQGQSKVSDSRFHFPRECFPSYFPGSANFTSLSLSLSRSYPDIVCFFARFGLWPNYPQRMEGRVQQMSRQIFELDDNRVRVMCRPQFNGNRPPPPGFFPPGGGPGVCCRPGGNVYPTRASTSTTKFDTETFPPDDYETYTGTGTGSYTGGGEEDNEYGRLQGRPKKKVLPEQKQQQRMVRTFTNKPSSGTMAAASRTTTATPPSPVQHKRNKRERNRVRSLRHKDVVVSFVEWQRRRAQSNHQL